ncbi:MAG: NRDE family protein [bacterium]|nr:NRDE family protein [bacterium]MDT8366654.1 NRDE family protein [bacterium]
MCLIVFAYKYHPHYPLILAANRDEFYERPTSRSHFWKDHPDLLGGRDMKHGGTWMGITKSGRFAAVTNYRERAVIRAHPLSRGLLVKDFLTNRDSPETFLNGIIPRAEEYRGFNLLLGDQASLIYYSNRSCKMQALKPGIYGLSNHLMDTPWPKLVRTRQALTAIIEGSDPISTEQLSNILYDKSPAADNELPDTGFELEWEKVLSSPFIVTPTYGTKASTVLLLDTDGQVTFTERSFTGPEDQGQTIHHEFTLTVP